ncbi:electron transport complex subunit RsxA [Prevotella lacticifex]|uniref:Ion-translocating oxidoreductase complex subunit A n=1 Tax=Prevotella lacticifex TaxID=2854755 RepID=A0A9R1CAS5_9BACT|nr:electron transport complex subunit RsxA [Prevotella lacticifex]GJG35926.1 electron transport complex subunit A [Prevotella lacticifex]GJG39024.1 electron transport complex subunit A [Prevotella lacticifex]GJG42295.1 electron transport complex subunit A [Prevotella lacticifex]GJG45379.1 electron transport complex subunit A [Prevotella lacticifex]GJG48646.1 electron transport complex subunit A [Prevotella lacticifex]
MEYLLIFISAIFVNNIVLSQFLGICPFLGVSKKISTSLGMGAAVTFVLTLSTIVTYLVQVFVLNPFHLEYLQTLAFILVIAALVQMVEIILKKVSPALYQALGIFLPLITTNCAVLGVAILVIQRDYNLLESVVYAFSTALGFAVALVIFAGIREQLALVNIPKGMRGMPIVLITASLLALAFMGFSGLQTGLGTLFGVN